MHLQSRLRALPLLLLTVQNQHGHTSHTSSGRPSSASLQSSQLSDSQTPDSSLRLRMSMDVDGQLLVDRVFPDMLSPIVESPAVSGMQQSTHSGKMDGQGQAREATPTAAGGEGEGQEERKE